MYVRKGLVATLSSVFSVNIRCQHNEGWSGEVRSDHLRDNQQSL